jgi:uncharacterized MAPEG superfamily protein
MSSFRLHVTGTVTHAECRFQRNGIPQVIAELKDATGQTVRAHHNYPDASATSAFAARALCRQLKGQQAQLDAINPRFKAKRLDCEALLITTTHLSSNRMDLS